MMQPEEFLRRTDYRMTNTGLSLSARGHLRIPKRGHFNLLLTTGRMIPKCTEHHEQD